MFISDSRLSVSLPPTEIFIFVVKMPSSSDKERKILREVEEDRRSGVKVEKKIESDQGVEEREKALGQSFPITEMI